MNPLQQVRDTINEIILNEMYHMFSEVVLVARCFLPSSNKEDNKELETMKYFKEVGENKFLFNGKWFDIEITKAGNAKTPQQIIDIDKAGRPIYDERERHV